MATQQEMTVPGWEWRDQALPHPSTTVRYRADIDGLRAIAVLAVILFHAGSGLFSGGFVGVDIFFVISGYLITSIILADAEKGRFSILSFYDRRVRRIFPALFLMLGGTAAIAYFTLLPTEMMLLGKTMAATAIFAANIYFWRETGYFAPQADENPLLHTWSLAVEEQFYVFFPLLLIFLLRSGNRRLVLLSFIALAVGSLAIAEWQVGSRPSAAFYLLPTRAWELLMGAVLALGLLKPPGERMAAIYAAVGMTMIAWAILMYAPGMRFPGVSALLPCLGTALLIHAGTNGSTIGSGLLCARPTVFVGQISYSLYLWHWPLLIIPSLYYDRELTSAETLLAIAAAFLFSTLSLKLVETPFRKRRQPDRARRVVASGVLVSAAFFAFGVWMLTSEGAPWRYSQKVVMADRARMREVLPANCVDIGSRNRCADKKFEILVWGDSHAGHYFPALDRMANSMHLTAQVQSIGGCPPLLGVEPVTVPRAGTAAGGERVRYEEGCVGANEDIMRMIAAKPEVRVVALAGAWSFWSEATEIGTAEGRYLAVPGTHRYSRTESRRLMQESLARTIARLRNMGVRILLLGQVPDLDISPPRCMADAYRRATDVSLCAPVTMAALGRLNWSRAWLGAAAGDGMNPVRDGVYFFDPAPILCRTEHCMIESRGQPLYRDTNHLTTYGAVALGRHFMDAAFMLASKPRRQVEGQPGIAAAGL